MSRLWSAGAELQTVTAGIEFTAAVATAPGLETSIKRSGNAAWRITNTGAQEGFRQAFTAAQGDYYFRFYLYVVAFPAGDKIIAGFGLNGSYKGCIRLTTGGTLQLYEAEDDVVLGSDSSALSLNTWYRVEIKHDSTVLSSTFIESRAYTDTPGNTTPFWNASGTGDITATPTNVRVVMPAGDASLDYIVDDLALNDTSGGIQNSWCGEGEVIVLRPNGVGDNTDWARGGSDTGANWSQVNEVPPDTAQYVESNTSGQIDDYAMEATPAALESTDVINAVQVGVYGATDSASGPDPDVVLRIKSESAGTVDESAALDVNSVTYQGPAPLPANSNYQLSVYDLPGASTGTWSKATLDTMQAGVREAATDTNFVRIAALWVTVDHKPGSGGGTTPVSGSDSLSISLTEASSINVALSSADSLTLSLTEAGSVVVEVAPSDSLALSLTESASVVVIVEPADSLTLSLTESASINVVIDVADNLTLSLTEDASVEVSAAYDVADSLTLSLTEAASVVVSVSVSDSLTISITESGSPAVLVDPSDTTDLGITEASSVVVSVNPSDNLDLSLSDASVITVSNNVSDTLSLSITETSEIFVSVSVTDTLSLSITETSSSSLSVNPDDSLGLGITDTASVVVSVSPSDSLTISLTESGSITLSNDVSASDTLSISLTESASVEIAQAVSVSDTLSISLTETAQIDITVSVIDSVSISITETSTSDGDASSSDTTGISLTESASIAVSVSVSDNLDISLTEAGVIVATTVAVPISGSDTLTISITETAVIVATTPPVVLVVRGQLVIYDYYSTDLGVGDDGVSMLSIDDSRLYNIVVGDE